jgi:hypothetical protein
VIQITSLILKISYNIKIELKNKSNMKIVEDWARSIVCQADQLDFVDHDILIKLIKQELKDVDNDLFYKLVEQQVITTWVWR